MNIEQCKWTAANGWTPRPPSGLNASAQLVLLFGATPFLKEAQHVPELQKLHPAAHIFGCSTAGEICGVELSDDSLVATAIYFEATQVAGTQLTLRAGQNSFQAGRELALALEPEGLAHVLVLSDGLHVNGSELVQGLVKHLPPRVTVTGGLAGDGDRFQQTFVCLDRPPAENTIALVGFYGSRLKVGYGSFGGWDPFGPERLITRARENVLYELDGQSALVLYKKYLGAYAADLPASGLLFPLSLRAEQGETSVVRTILAVNEDEQSLTFAGDLPEGAYARFMKANFERLIDGATGAAQTSYEGLGSFSPDLALLISCVGRKLVLKQRTEEELEAVREVFGARTILTGFYSYGEIGPAAPHASCELHNQTMTITTFAEK